MTHDELMAAIRSVPEPDATAIATKAVSFAGNVAHLGQGAHSDLVAAHLGVSDAIASTLRYAPDAGLAWERLRAAVSTIMAPPPAPDSDRRRFTEDWMAQATDHVDAGRADLAAICAALADLYDEDEEMGRLVP